MDLKNDPHTLCMMEIVPRPKPRELSEAEQWYISMQANAHPVNYGPGAQACTTEQLAELSRNPMYGWSLQRQSQGPSFLDELLGGAFGS